MYRLLVMARQPGKTVFRITRVDDTFVFSRHGYSIAVSDDFAISTIDEVLRNRDDYEIIGGYFSPKSLGIGGCLTR